MKEGQTESASRDLVQSLCSPAIESVPGCCVGVGRVCGCAFRSGVVCVCGWEGVVCVLEGLWTGRSECVYHIPKS